MTIDRKIILIYFQMIQKSRQPVTSKMNRLGYDFNVRLNQSTSLD